MGLKAWELHVISALCFDIELLLAAFQEDLAIMGWLYFSYKPACWKIYRVYKRGKMWAFKSKLVPELGKNQS